jgi:phage gpG-like protein
MPIRVNGTGDLERDLEELQRKLENPEPLMRSIESIAHTETMRNFENERDSFGNNWRPSRRAIKDGGRTLHSGNSRRRRQVGHRVDHLQDAIYTGRSGRSAKVGTNMVYGRTHQLGDSSRNIPKRPFLPIDENGNLPEHLSEEISSVVSEYLFGG